jgi:hypothetical protein
VAAALQAELGGLDQTLSRSSEALENITRDHYLMPDPGQSVRVFPHMLPKIGLLDPTTIRSTVDAYLMIDQYSESLLLIGGNLSQKAPHRRLIEMPSNSANLVMTLNKVTSEAIQRALSNLDGHLHRP